MTCQNRRQLRELRIVRREMETGYQKGDEGRAPGEDTWAVRREMVEAGCRRSPWLAKAERCWCPVEESAHARCSNGCREGEEGQAGLTGSKNLRSCYYGVGNQGVMLGT